MSMERVELGLYAGPATFGSIDNPGSGVKTTPEQIGDEMKILTKDLGIFHPSVMNVSIQPGFSPKLVKYSYSRQRWGRAELTEPLTADSPLLEREPFRHNHTGKEGCCVSRFRDRIL
jgi:hypothetical protein